MGLRVGAVVIDCNDLDRMLVFWRAVTGYEPGPVVDGFVVLAGPGDTANVSLQRVPEPRLGKNRLHLDLYADDRVAEAARLEALGATRVRVGDDPADPFVVLTDPEGNEFCVVGP